MTVFPFTFAHEVDGTTHVPSVVKVVTWLS